MTRNITKSGSQAACGPEVVIPITSVDTLHRRPLMTGECVIWTGIFLASIQALNSVPTIYPRWFGYAMIVSPLFTIFIVTKVNFKTSSDIHLTLKFTGIPPLEYQMNKQFRGRKDYEAYKSATPILIPKL